jgi:hypothetical protein
MGEGQIFIKTSAPLSLTKTCRMNPFSAKSISLDDTFNGNSQNATVLNNMQSRRSFGNLKLYQRDNVVSDGGEEWGGILA